MAEECMSEECRKCATLASILEDWTKLRVVIGKEAKMPKICQWKPNQKKQKQKKQKQREEPYTRSRKEGNEQ